MERKIPLTKDGSHTVSVPEWNVAYHSFHGALRESQHVFIDSDLKYILSLPVRERIFIFEMGFGTGLNVLLTLTEASKRTRMNIPNCMHVLGKKNLKSIPILQF
jgi:tRNA U34 5-methylaminomethyl-2-thiouridine-forming methyltransferase MnmC